MIQTKCLLSVAEKCDLAADHQDTKTKLPKIWYLLNFLTSTEYIKTFPFFHKLSSNDQYVLARYVILPCFNLHNSYFSISKKYDTCLQPDGAKEPTEEDRHYSFDVKAVGPLIRCQIELIEYILLKAICISQLQLRCQSCRYKKCIEVGMNSKALELNETEKEALNFKKLAEVEKEQLEFPTIQAIISKENQNKTIIDMLCYLELKIDQFKNSAYNPLVIDYMKTTEELVTRKSILCLADHLGPMSGWPINRKVELPKVSRMRDVPDIDMKYSGPPARPIFSPANQKMWMFFNMMTTIEYAKTFNFLQKLDLNDQIVLVGQTTLLCMNLHNSYYAVSRKMEKCMHPDGTEQPQRDEYHYPVVSMALAPLIRCDIQPIEYILLKAIGLCNPTVHGLSEHGQTIIAKERQQFSDVLLDHCLRNRSDGPSRFVELLGIISVLLRQQRLQKDIHIYHISPIISRFPFPVQFLDEIMYS
ncbi:hypothetical protein B9Z55_018570 [Caenorhabditis nigoni]|nr:hypothetical protein B9Z55_018570 [Caenorhabditis nigoni]